MARPRSFNTDQVLDQVMLLFWEKGYGATSMMDIQQATGLKPGSLYDTFGGKSELFFKAIDHYRDSVVRKRLNRLHQPGPVRERIQAFFDDLIEFSLGEGKKLGCLMSNTAVELAPHDPAAKTVVQENLLEIAQTFCDLIEEGKNTGELKTTESPEDLARFLTSTVQGLRVMAKSSTTRETLTTTVRLALKILE